MINNIYVLCLELIHKIKDMSDWSKIYENQRLCWILGKFIYEYMQVKDDSILNNNCARLEEITIKV